MLKTLAKRATSRSLWSAIREVSQEWRIQNMHRASSRKARTLWRGEPLRLNMASGHHPKPGWVNIDLFAPAADLRLDLREPLPFPNESIAYIYAEHFFEHLNYAELSDSAGWEGEGPGRPSEAMAFLRECRRVLVHGGVLDVVVPDAEGIIQEYASRHVSGFPKYEWWGPKWCDTPMHCVNYVFRQGREHKYAYDEQTLQRVMESAGFASAARRAFEPGRDLPNHEIGSLCMVATKAAG
jgi:predicted SAM-dependent methyltransferase